MMKTKVFVTGGAGVIGRSWCRAIRAGADVLVGDLKEKPDHFTDELKYVRGDPLAVRKSLTIFLPKLFFTWLQRSRDRKKL